MRWHRQRVMRTPLEVIMDVEAELALHGYSDPSASLFRGCHICLLPSSPLPPPSSLQPSASQGTGSPQGSSVSEHRLFQTSWELAQVAADTEQALLECQARRVSLQACPLLAQRLDSEHSPC